MNNKVQQRLKYNFDRRNTFTNMEIATSSGLCVPDEVTNVVIDVAYDLCENDYQDEFDAFCHTCVKEDIRGEVLQDLFAQVCLARLENCFALVLAINAGIIDPQEVKAAIENYDEMNVESLVKDLKLKLPGFSKFYNELAEKAGAALSEVLTITLPGRPPPEGLSYEWPPIGYVH